MSQLSIWEATKIVGKRIPELSEVMWEGMEYIVQMHGNLVWGDALYASVIREKSVTLENCIGFVDGSILKFAQPTIHDLQNVVYNGHKRSHELKFQALVSPDGFSIHIYGPHEGRQHDLRFDVVQIWISN